MADLRATCSSCKKEVTLETSSSITNNGKSADVNRRAVYHTVESGSGYEGLSSFCAVMNMQCMSKTAYYQHLERIVIALEAEAKEEMKEAAKSLRKKVLEESGCKDVNSVVDVAISFDGTWAKRGFTSLFGVVFVISIDSGEVLDYHVISKSCQKCCLSRSKCKTDEEFEEWEIEHVFRESVT